MGLISLLIKIFFFYMLFMLFSGLIKAYQSYKAVQDQMRQQQNHNIRGERRSYADTYNDPQGQTIDAEFTVVDEKEV